MVASSWRGRLLFLYGLLMRQRKAKGLTQADVAARIGVSLSTFKRIELGHAHPGTVELFRWGDLLGVEVTGTLASESVTDDTGVAA